MSFCKFSKKSLICLFKLTACDLTQTQHVVGSTGVLNNHETYFWFFWLEQTDRHTGVPVEVPPVLNNNVTISFSVEIWIKM